MNNRYGHVSITLIPKIFHKQINLFPIRKEDSTMTLYEFLTKEFEDGTPEKAFRDIVSKEYEKRFNSDDFDTKFNDVAGYKPVKTSAMVIARNYVDGLKDLSESDKNYIIDKFSEAYDDVNKESMNIHAILDGIVDDILEEDLEDDIDFEPTDDEDGDDDDIDEIFDDDD